MTESRRGGGTTSTKEVGGTPRAVDSAPKIELDLLESKLSPPHGLNRRVERGRLLATLAESAPVPVVLISAPAGYGKTTLLAQWASKSELPPAWISIDERDNDPVVLLAYLMTAIDRVSPLGDEIFEALGVPEASVEGGLVPALIAAIERTRSSFALILDDVHRLTNSQCVYVVETLMTHVPPGSQLVLAGRNQPSGPTAALRTNGLVLEIGPGELRMDKEDAAELMSGAGVSLSESRVAHLVERTEGWPAGLYLGALSARSGGSLEVKGDSFRGNHRLVEDYLRSELLANLPADELEFLKRTSVLDRLCAPLCDAILGSTGSGTVLSSLEQSNLFVVPLDQNRDWFRYHRLFRELLLAELNRTEPKLVQASLITASDWSSRNGAPDDAVAYAQAAGDAKRVGALVIARAQIEYRRGRAATVESWLDWMEQNDALESSPLIAALGSWFSALRGDVDRAERWTAIACRSVENQDPGDDRLQVEAWLCLIRAMGGATGVERMLADAEFAETTFDRAGPWWLTGALTLGVVRIFADDADGADRLFERVVDSAEPAGAWNAASLGLAERATLAIHRDDWVAAKTLAGEAETIMRKSRMEAYPPNLIVYAAAARVAAHRRESERAGKLLLEAQKLRPRLTRALAPLAVQSRLELALAYIALADTAGARTMLSEASGLLSGGRDFGTLGKQADDVRTKLETARTVAPGASTLTAAELRLLPLLPSQLSFPEIGERLFLSRHTVKTHAMAIYRKLEVTSRTEAVERARTLGLL